MPRARIPIDWELVKKLCAIHCTLEEIAGFVGCSGDTVERSCKRDHRLGFAEAYKLWSAGGKISLRRYQWKAAEKGNPAMLIWLGKQHLYQREKPAEDADAANAALFTDALTIAADRVWDSDKPESEPPE